jgi:hypothetical protein
MKALRAYGPEGGHGEHWNWCAPGELVCWHGFVCDNGCQCGCDRSFTGLRTSKCCTQAEVVELSEGAFQTALANFLHDLLDQWPGKDWAEHRAWCEEVVRGMPERIANAGFQAGDVLEVRKGGAEDRLKSHQVGTILTVRNTKDGDFSLTPADRPAPMTRLYTAWRTGESVVRIVFDGAEVWRMECRTEDEAAAELCRVRARLVPAGENPFGVDAVLVEWGGGSFAWLKGPEDLTVVGPWGGE